MFDSGGAGLTAYTYDDDDDLLSTTRGFSGAAGVLGTGVATDYAYYPDGSLETMSFPGLGTQFHSLDSSFPSGNTPTYTYDYNGIGQLNGMTNPFGDKPGWGYLGNGWMSVRRRCGSRRVVQQHSLDLLSVRHTRVHDGSDQLRSSVRHRVFRLRRRYL